MSAKSQGEMEAMLREQRALDFSLQPTTLKRCLGEECGEWMHSTGPDHRICNKCKGLNPYWRSRVGERAGVIRPR